MPPACGRIAHGLIVTKPFSIGNVDDNLKGEPQPVHAFEFARINHRLDLPSHGYLYLAGIIGGVLILVAERLSRRAEPSDADVRRAAERYRQWYGDRALNVIGDHMLGARFAPDSKHTQFLKRVVGELQAGAVTQNDRCRAIDH